LISGSLAGFPFYSQVIIAAFHDLTKAFKYQASSGTLIHRHKPAQRVMLNIRYNGNGLARIGGPHARTLLAFG
jgi:hypothetical protein